MSKTIAIRVSDEIHSALEAQCLATGKTMTQLVTPIILGCISLPPTPPSPIEERLSVLEDRLTAIAKLETQMSEVVDRLDAIEVGKVALAVTSPAKEQLKTEIAQQALFDTGLKPMEPGAIDSKISSESDRDSDEAGISTSEFTQYVEPLLRAYSRGGYYFRFEWLGQTELAAIIKEQAKLLGFKTEPIKVDGKNIRVWLNREYCLQVANTLQTTNP